MISILYISNFFYFVPSDLEAMELVTQEAEEVMAPAMAADLAEDLECLVPAVVVLTEEGKANKFLHYICISFSFDIFTCLVLYF